MFFRMNKMTVYFMLNDTWSLFCEWIPIVGFHVRLNVLLWSIDLNWPSFTLWVVLIPWWLFINSFRPCVDHVWPVLSVISCSSLYMFLNVCPIFMNHEPLVHINLSTCFVDLSLFHLYLMRFVHESLFCLFCPWSSCSCFVTCFVHE